MIPQDDALRLQLALIAGNEPVTSRIEIRWRSGTGHMRQQWTGVRELDRARAAIRNLQQQGDVYVGAAPRVRDGGTAADVERDWALWVDLDTPEAAARVHQFTPAPNIILESGSGGAHAWWQLSRPLGGDWARRANRRLAHALGGDMKATDPARVMRPAGSLNWKHNPPRPVNCIRLELTAYTAADVVGDLPDPPQPTKRRSTGTPIDVGDVLHSIPATEYVPALSGVELGRDGKIRCPFHEDGTPSLHAYDGDRGWACFGCGRGGTIIDFGAAMFGIEPRGRGYHEIRRLLASALLGIREAA